MRMVELPAHDVPQALRLFPVECFRQLLQLSMCLRTESGLPPDTVAFVARLRGRGQHKRLGFTRWGIRVNRAVYAADYLAPACRF